MGSLLLLLIPLALFVMLRANPQRRRVMAQQSLLGNLSPGDRVVTASGIVGTLVGIEGDRAGVEVAPGVVVEFLVPAIVRRADEGLASDAPPVGGGLVIPDNIDVPDDLSSMELPHESPSDGGDATEVDDSGEAGMAGPDGDPHDSHDSHDAHPAAGSAGAGSAGAGDPLTHEASPDAAPTADPTAPRPEED